jgi:hypothetical protein
MNYSLFEVGKTPLIPSFYSKFGNKCVPGQNFTMTGKKWSACDIKSGIRNKTGNLSKKNKSMFGKKKSNKSRKIEKIHSDILSIVSRFIVVKAKRPYNNKNVLNALDKKVGKMKKVKITKKFKTVLKKLFRKYKIEYTKTNELVSLKKLVKKMKSDILSSKKVKTLKSKKVSKKSKKVKTLKSKSRVSKKSKKVKTLKSKKVSKKSKKVKTLKSKSRVRLPRSIKRVKISKKHPRKSRFGTWWDNTQKEYLLGQQSSMDSAYPFYNNDKWVPYANLGKNAFGNEVPYVPGAGPYPSAVSSSYPFTML